MKKKPTATMDSCATPGCSDAGVYTKYGAVPLCAKHYRTYRIKLKIEG